MKELNETAKSLKTSGEITSLVEELNSMVGLLSNNLGTLEERLSPITLSSPQRAGTEAADMKTALGQDLLRALLTVQYVNSRVIDLRDSLEL